MAGFRLPRARRRGSAAIVARKTFFLLLNSNAIRQYDAAAHTTSCARQGGVQAAFFISHAMKARRDASRTA